MKPAALSVSVALCLGAIPMAGSANAEILNYECIVGQVKVALRVDTVLLTATEMTRADGTVEIARYSDGVFESVSDVGAARSIPPAHQFVRIEGQKIFSKKVRAVSTSCQKFLTRVATIPEFCFLSRTQQFARIGAHVGARHGHQG
jgi:hypothetical protein